MQQPMYSMIRITKQRIKMNFNKKKIEESNDYELLTWCITYVTRLK